MRRLRTGITQICPVCLFECGSWNLPGGRKHSSYRYPRSLCQMAPRDIAEDVEQWRRREGPAVADAKNMGIKVFLVNEVKRFAPDALFFLEFLIRLERKHG